MIDCGAEEIELEDGVFEVSGPMEVFGEISKKLEEMKLEPEEAGLQQIPTTFKEVSDESYLNNMKLIEKLEADDDVVTVYHNIEFSEHFNDL